jgi:hypothetical protein
MIFSYNKLCWLAHFDGHLKPDGFRCQIALVSVGLGVKFILTIFLRVGFLVSSGANLHS